jgi:uncharacterized repeat protein (TIGR01451 family)
MVKSRFTFILLGLTLLLSLVGGLAVTTNIALAQSPTPEITPAPSAATDLLSLETDIPSYKDTSGATFNFSVTIKYNGTDRQTLNLSTSTASPGWTSTVSYSGKQANSLDIGPAGSYGPDTKSVTVTLTPPTYQKPDPGNYIVTLSVAAGIVTKTIDLTGEVMTRYDFSMTSDTGRLSTEATAGQDNHYAVTLTNSGSVPLTNITFSSSKPDNWTVKFNPEKVESLDPNATKQLDVVIAPPSGKTIAGDYMITLTASNDKVNSSMDVRITALTPSIWGWVGIIIVVVVIAGLAVLFLKLGRR